MKLTDDLIRILKWEIIPFVLGGIMQNAELCDILSDLHLSVRDQLTEDDLIYSTRFRNRMEIDDMSMKNEIARAEELARIHGVRYAVVDTAGWVTPYQVVPFDSAREMHEAVIYITAEVR